MSKEYSAQDLFSGKLFTMNFGDSAFTPSVKYIQRESLPMIHVMWTNRILVFIDEEDVVEISDRYPTIEISVGTDGRRYVYAALTGDDGEPKINHTWICNFHRTGWLESTSPDGKEGYSNGIIYANNVDGGLTCSTPEQVIRETLLKFIEKSRIPAVVKEHVAVRPLWQALLDDALANISKFAGSAVNSTNGAIDDIIVNGTPFEWRAE